MTEYNIKINGDDPIVSGVYTNGFTHGFVLQEWFLKNLKVNFASGYKKNFFTYSTFQNYAGVGEDILTPSDRPRELYNHLCMDYPPYNLGGGNPNQRSYHMKRTSYFIMSMLREISAQDLKYVTSRYVTTTSNINTSPTMFTDPGYNNLYLYFSNVKSTEQDYIINGENLALLFDPIPIISFGEATIRKISALQLYSNSGSSTLFEPLFNTGYSNPTPGDHTCYGGELLPPSYLYPVEIQTASFIINSPDCAATPGTTGGCITFPPYSIGYVKIPIQKNYRFALQSNETDNEIIVYPNPANTWFSFYQTNESGEIAESRVEIYSLTGNFIHSIKVNAYMPVDITNLPVGIYLIKIFKHEELLSVKTLIKTN